MLNIERLHTLHLVATHGSIVAAADTLHITPSGASQQLAKLEREVGDRLLEPRGRGVRLTPAGELLAEHAAGIVARLATADAELEALRGEVSGPLRFGAIATAARALLPPAMDRLQRRHPRLGVTLAEGEAETTLPALLAGDLDVAVVENWDTLATELPAGVQSEPLVSDVADVALSAHHPLAERDGLDLDELSDTSWAAWTQGSRSYHWLVQTLRQQNVEPRVRCTVDGYPTQLSLVAAGLVAAFLPRLGRSPLPEGVRVVATRPVLGRTIHAVRRTGTPRPAVRAGVTVLAEVAGELAERAAGQP